MDHFEKKLIYPFIKGFSLIYLRFIDDILFIWTGNKKDIMRILKELNRKHESISFEYQVSKTGITFLDTEVHIMNNKLCIKICRKKTDRRTFINKTSIPNSQALRIKRIWLRTTSFEYHLQEIKERLVNQCYNEISIDQQFSKVKTIDRN